MAKRKFLMPGEGQTFTVTVTQDIPNFEITVDGSDTPVPAFQQKIMVPQDGGGFLPQDITYPQGARVQASDQSPQIPIVTGYI